MRSRRISATVNAIMSASGSGLRGGGEDGQEGQGEHGQGDVAVPAGPAADLVVVQADLAFGGLESFLDAHRMPATRTSVCSGTGRGDQQR